MPDYSKVDEIPFDFSRKMMSVVVETPAGESTASICKGAPEAVFKRCTHFELDGKIYPDGAHADRRTCSEEYDELSADGFRVLAIAYKDLERQAAYSKDDERDLILKGYVAFLDPPKDTAAAGHPGAARARHHGQGPHRRQRSGQPQDLPAKSASTTDHMLLGGAGGSHDRRRTGRGGRADHALRPALARPQAAHHPGPAEQGPRRRLPGRRHQRRAGAARRRRGHLRRHRGGHRQGSPPTSSCWKRA